MATNIIKLDRFKRRNFFHWQKKMHFFLTTLEAAYVRSDEESEKESMDYIHLWQDGSSSNYKISFL